MGFSADQLCGLAPVWPFLQPVPPAAGLLPSGEAEHEGLVPEAGLTQPGDLFKLGNRSLERNGKESGLRICCA